MVANQFFATYIIKSYTLFDSMATFLIDLDGVTFKHSTMEFNDGALSCLKKIKDEGHNLVFTTARKAANNNIPSLQLDLTIAILNDLQDLTTIQKN